MTPTDSLDLRSRVHALAEEVLAETDLFLVDVEVRGQQGSRVLEVYVDGPQGAGLDAIAVVSRELAFLLDAQDLVKGRYHLNVSSPGAARPLRDPRQWPQHLGRALRVTTGAGDDARTRTGTLTAVADASFTLDVDGASETIAFTDVSEARVELPW